MLKLHLFDMLWICCTACCTTNPQQVEMSTIKPQQVKCQDVDLLWTTTHPQQIAPMWFEFRLVVDL